MGAIWDQDLVDGGGTAAPWEQDLLPVERAQSPSPSPVQQYVGPWRGAALGGQAVVQGLTGLAGLPGNLERLGTNYIENPIRGVLGLPAAHGYTLPSSADLEAITDRLGLTGYANIQPSTPVERLGTAVIRGGTGGAATKVLTGLGSLLPMVLTSAGSDAAAQTTKEVLGQDVNPLIPMGVGLGTGLLTARPAASFDAWTERKGAEAAAEAAAAAQRAAAKAALYGKGTIADAAKQQVSSAQAARDSIFTRAANDLASQEGAANGLIANTRAGLTGLPPQSAQKAGEAVQNAGRNWFSRLPDRMRQIWDPVDQAIPGDTVVTPGNFVQELERTTRRASNPVWQEGLNMLQARLPQNLQGMLERVQQAGGAIPTMTWGDARAYRDALGDALANKGLVKDATQAQLSGLYRSVTEDMRGAASGLPDVTIGGTGGIGVRASPAVLFDQANAEATRLHGFIEGPLRKVITSPDAVGERLAGEKVVGDLLTEGKAGASTLGPLAQELGPEFTNPLLGAHLAPGAGGGKGLATWDQMSDAAKQALVSDPSARASLDAAHDLLATARANHGTTRQAAEATFQQAKQTAQDQAAAARRALTIGSAEAGFAKTDTRNALTRLSDRMQGGEGKLAALLIGEMVGQGLEGGLLHLGNQYLSGAATAAAAYAAAPWLAKNTFGTLAMPGAWPYIASGALGASQGGRNVLTSQSPTAYDPVAAGTQSRQPD